MLNRSSLPWLHVDTKFGENLPIDRQTDKPRLEKKILGRGEYTLTANQNWIYIIFKSKITVIMQHMHCTQVIRAKAAAEGKVQNRCEAIVDRNLNSHLIISTYVQYVLKRIVLTRMKAPHVLWLIFFHGWIICWALPSSSWCYNCCYFCI